MPIHCPRPLMFAVIMLMITVAARAQNAPPSSLRFEENRGQIVDVQKHHRPDILYTVRGGSVNAYLRNAGLSYVFIHAERDTAALPSELRMLGDRRTDSLLRLTTYRMDMELVGADTNARVTAEFPSAEVANFYLPQCPQGITDVHGYGRVTYHDIYPHIDLVYYSTSGAMKYDFVVRPGGRVQDIRLCYVGDTALEILPDGAIRARTPYGQVVDGRPVAYAASASGRHAAAVEYRLDGGKVSFDVGAYNSAATLTIDPQILWSTYLGGSTLDASPITSLDGSAHGCSSDHDTLITVGGVTKSPDFPTTPGVFSRTKSGPANDYDFVVARFTYRGVRLWSTYYGGSNEDMMMGAYTDATGRSYTVGYTASYDVTITPGAFNPTHGALRFYDGLLVVFDRDGHLAWSTFVNGTYLAAVVSDTRGNVVVGGSGLWFMPTSPGAYRATPPPNGSASAALVKFTPSGARIWQTFYGGLATDEIGDVGYDAVQALATDSLGNIAACGETVATDFPLINSRIQNSYLGLMDGWVALFDSGSTPRWSTYIGGRNLDMCNDVRFDPRGNLLLLGVTASTDFPILGNADQPFRGFGAGTRDVVLARLDAAGAIIWSTYLGGGNDESGVAVDADHDCNIWVAGSTRSTDFPTTADAFQRTLHGAGDAVLAKYDSSGRRVWSTYLGGAANEYPGGLATTLSGVVTYGTTLSDDFPMAGTPFQSARRGEEDLFLAFFCDVHAAIETHGRPTRFCFGDSLVLSATPGFTSYRWSNGATTPNITVKSSGTFTVTVDYIGCSAVTDPVTVIVDTIPQRRLQPGGSIVICAGDTTLLRLNIPASTYRWSTGDTTATLAVWKAGRYTASFSDAHGCSNHTDTVTVTVSPRPATAITALGPLSFCEGGSVTLDAGAGFAGYQWSTGETTRRITVSKAGSYSVRVMNADGCWGPFTSVIIVKTFPIPTVTTRNVLPTKFCEGDSTIIVASPTTFASYLWSTGETTPTIVIKKDGTYTLVATDSNGCTATTQVSVSVTPRPRPQLAISGPVRFCRGDSVVLSASGFAQIQWSNGSTATSIVVKDPGKYFATVTSAEGCPGVSDTVTVEVMPLPSVAISGPIRVCPSTLASYSAPVSSRTQYTWTVPSGGAIVSGAGTSVVSVQWAAAGNGVLGLHVTNDSTGCSADTTITVTIGSSLKPVVTANRSLRLCTGDSVTLDAGAYATYQWSTGATGRTITIGSPGSYTVTVADAKGCSGTSDPVEVTLNVPPQPVIAVPNGGVFCAGDSIVLDAGAGYAKYLWSNGFTSQRITLRATSRVSVSVTDTNGCTGTSAEVGVISSPQTPPLVNGPAQVCQNSTVTYSTPATGGSTYQWNVSGGALLSGQGSASIRIQWGGAGAGRIDLVETTSLGCTGTSPGLDVTIGDHLVPTVTPAGPVALCPGSTIHLDAGAGYASYQWSTGEKTQAIDVTSAGSYAVTVADSSGCSGTSDPVNVFAKASPVPAISGGPLEFCEGGSVTLTAEPGYTSYLWSTGATTPAVTITTAGSYTVTVMDIDGCSGASNPVEVIVDPLPAKPAITLAGDQLTSTPAATYQWLLGGAAIPGATSQTLQATANGTYRVIVQNQYGCAAVSDPVQYRIGTAARLVMLDTISARVGDRAYLTMRVMPALTAADAVHAYHAELRYDPRALFIHDVISPDRATTGDPAMHQTNVTGLLTVDRPATSPVLVGSELFRVELEGLVTGQPLDVMTIERIVMPEVTGVSVAGSGLVILSGCEIGTAFSKVVRIETIRPNPAHEEMVVRYRLPVGRTGELRLSDAAGRELVRATTPVGTGTFEDLRVDLAHVASGAYMVELRDGTERSAVPVVIVK